MTSDSTRPTTDEVQDGTGPSLGHGRRSVLRGVAVVGAVGLSGSLAGCGGSGSDGAAQAPAAASGPTALGAATEIPVGGGKIFANDKVVVTQPTKGTFKAFSAVCTHEGCIVAAVTKTIDCACHGSKYSITDGSVVAPPAPSPLPAKTVTVEGGQVTVTL
jgi:nitrite reductase/ring-hydroxylating ferredoxin subunit